jgi:hypothetical protein
MAITNGSGVGRTAPKTNQAGFASLSDDERKNAAFMIVGFNTQLMNVTNAAGITTPNNMIV